MVYIIFIAFRAWIRRLYNIILHDFISYKYFYDIYIIIKTHRDMSKTKRNNLDRKLAIDQLAELLKAGQQIKLTASKGSQKGHSDLPLFLRPQDQQKLF